MPALALTRAIGRLLIGVLLASQWLLAAYACPGERGGEAGTQRTAAVFGATDEEASAVGAAATAAMVDCESMAAMDAAAPNLCHGHCQQGQHSDQTSVPVLTAAVAGGFYVLLPAPSSRLQRLSGGSAPDRFCAAFPPHATLHCCLRV